VCPNRLRLANWVCIDEGYRVVKAITQSQIRWANEIASSASSDEILSALSLMRNLRLRLEADERSRK
jgi:hypothetical protein